MSHHDGLAGPPDFESALGRALAFSERLVEALPVGVLYIDAADTITYENPTMREIMGMDRDAPSLIVGRRLKDIPQVRAAGILPLLARCRQGEAIAGQAVRYTSLVGHDVDIELFAAPLMDASGAWQGAIVMVRDVRAQLQAEAQIRDRLRELTLLFETSAAVSTSLDVDTVLATTAQRISTALEVDGCAISLWDRARDAVITLLDYTPAPGTRRTVPAGSLYSLDRFPAWRPVLAECRSWAAHIDDPHLDPGARVWMEECGLRALLVVPLVVRGEAIGYIELMVRTHTRAFRPAEISLCETLANQAAAALENARLHAETERRLAEQIALRAAAAAISSVLDLTTVLARITEEMGRTAGATSAYICGYDPITRTSTVLAEYIGPEASQQERISDLGATYNEVDESFLDTLAAGEHFVFDIHDPGLAPSDREHMETYGATTILHIPMRLHGALVGYLELWESRGSRAFTVDEIDLCQDLAQQAVIALEHARLYEQAQAEVEERRRAEVELRRRNRELGVLNRVIVASARGEQVEPLLDTACRELADAFDLAHACATHLDREQTVTVTTVRPSAAAAHPGGARPTTPTTFPVAESPSYRQLVRDRQPITMSGAGPLMGDPLWPAGTTSFLLVPLLVEGELAGSLGLSDPADRAFAMHEIRLAQRVADQVAGSLLRARLRSEHAHLAEQLRLAQKLEALGQMAGGVAHDFNNLLTVISSTTGLLERELHAHDPAREHVRWIREAGERAARLTQQLLRFSRQEVVAPRIVSLNQALFSLRPMLARLLGPDITLQLSQAPGLWPVRIDPSQVDQILLNLVVNARAAMPGGGTVSIETANVVLDGAYVSRHLDSRPGDHVVLTVDDTGEGMTEEVRAHLFEPFFTTREGGTGLGLSTVYGIVHQNDGHITVASQAPGGTRFSIYFPRAADAAPGAGAPPGLVDASSQPFPTAALAPVAPPPAPAGQRVILLVEDEPALRSLATAILRDRGYHVLVAADGVEALHASREYSGDIDLVLTDVVMPRMNGQELARALAAERPGIHILYMSGYPDRLAASQLGAGYLPKPFTVEALVEHVEKAAGS